MTQTHIDQFYIDGAWCPATGTARAEVIDPATEMSAGSVALGEAADVDRAVAAARAAFQGFSQSSADSRMALLARISALMSERAGELAQAVTREMGSAIGFSRDRQVPAGIAHVDCTIAAMRDFPFQTAQGSTAILREPIGVCGLITPWNWPVYQITAKLAPALAAGCTVVLKPSELSPFSAQLLAQIIHDAGVPPGVFNMVFGLGEVVGTALSRHADVDMISITGSTRAGIAVARDAALTVKRVTQELGGKSPNILLPDADFAAAVPPGVLAGFRNVGQSCSAPTRMLVPADRLAEVEARVIDTVARLKTGDPTLPDTDLGPVANRRQFDRVQMMIEQGLAEGARPICGGPGRPDGLTRGFYCRPTVFSDVKTTMTIAQEEIFGPVLCLIPYASEDEAVSIANDTVYGLGAHVQSTDRDHARAVARRIRAGQVHLNYPAWDGMAPFGGYKQSGNGREYGAFGLAEFTEVKAVPGWD